MPNITPTSRFDNENLGAFSLIQILKQRFIDGKKPYFEFKEPIRVESIQYLFANLEEILDGIPEDERFNLHYTVHECGEKTRQFDYQTVIPFDIDGIDTERIDDYPEYIFNAIGNLNPSDCALIYSGNGIHVLVGVQEKIRHDHFKEYREFYKGICERIDSRLKKLNLPGKADPNLWRPKATLRLPGTKNIKTPETGYPNKNSRTDCEIITRVINDLPTNPRLLLGGELYQKKEDYLNVKPQSAGGKFPVDEPAVLSECKFLNWATKNAAEVSEPQWFRMVGITSFLENGREKTHEYSKDHPDYSWAETEEKINNALNFAPFTCKKVEEVYSGCETCPHYGKCTSPISIKSESFIKTKDNGFREIVYKKIGENPDGSDKIEVTTGKPCYEDLVKYYDQLHYHITNEAGSIYKFTGTHWEEVPSVFIRNFAQEHIKNPAPNSSQVSEFENLMERTNVKSRDFFENSSSGFMNLKNGVLNLKTWEVQKHSKKFFFMSCLSYDYDPKATCPTFDRFLNDITLRREDLQKVLMEFFGYAFSNEPSDIYQKCLILLGTGANGKSTLMETISDLAGEEAYSALNAKDFENPNFRAELEGKLFNMAEETPSKSFVDSSVFKNLVSGGSLLIRKLYCDSYKIKNKAKIIMAANKLPRTNDVSHGFFRRLIIIPFDARFEDDLNNRDVHIKSKLKKEASGILNRILEGYVRLKDQNRFTKSDTIEKEKEIYQEELDDLKSFVNECIHLEENEGGTPFDKIYREYDKYCNDSGIQFILKKNQLSKELAHYIPNWRTRKKRYGKDRSTIFSGVYLRTTATYQDF